jgi:selenocysteine lyase/cysteine desulfurase
MEPTRSCALATFNVEGMKAQDIVRFLYDKYNVFSVSRYWDDVQAVRITPNLYNSAGDVDRLIEGLDSLSKQ